jgi:PIN domain nuclease of toxin-antitoxin system
MNDYVADTHSLYWYLVASPRLGPAAKAAFEEASNGTALIHISAIVLAELYYLNAKHSFPINFAEELAKFDASSQFVLTPVEADDIAEFDNDQAISEMHDRIIVGLARRLNAPLLTIDQNLVKSKIVRIVW